MRSPYLHKKYLSQDLVLFPQSIENLDLRVYLTTNLTVGDVDKWLSEMAVFAYPGK